MPQWNGVLVVMRRWWRFSVLVMMSTGILHVVRARIVMRCWHGGAGAGKEDERRHQRH